MNARPPSQTYVSLKTVGTLEECLAQGFAWSGRATVIHGDDQVVIDYGNASSILTLTIYAKDGASVVEERHPIRKLAPDWRHHIERCVGIASRNRSVIGSPLR
jgi:hypothetical protein